MAFSIVGTPTTYEALSSNSATVNKPTGVAENDILFSMVMFDEPNSVPSGWTDLGYADIVYRVHLYYKVAGASEPANYTWGFASAGKCKVTMIAGRDAFNVLDPIDVVSNTGYITNNTTLRAASMTVSSANSVLLFFGAVYALSTNTFTKPSVPTTDWVEDYDNGSTSPDMWHTICHMTWTSSGATGNMDGTCSEGQTDKHAFAVALNPIALGPANLKSYNTNLKANIKTINTNPIANVKSLDTNI